MPFLLKFAFAGAVTMALMLLLAKLNAPFWLIPTPGILGMTMMRSMRS